MDLHVYHDNETGDLKLREEEHSADTLEGLKNLVYRGRLNFREGYFQKVIHKADAQNKSS